MPINPLAIQGATGQSKRRQGDPLWEAITNIPRASGAATSPPGGGTPIPYPQAAGGGGQVALYLSPTPRGSYLPGRGEMTQVQSPPTPMSYLGGAGAAPGETPGASYAPPPTGYQPQTQEQAIPQGMGTPMGQQAMATPYQAQPGMINILDVPSTPFGAPEAPPPPPGGGQYPDQEVIEDLIRGGGGGGQYPDQEVIEDLIRGVGAGAGAGEGLAGAGGEGFSHLERERDPFIEDYLKNIGEGADFDPIREGMIYGQGGMMEQLRQLYGAQAARGMGAAGATGKMARDVMAGASRDIAQRYQAFRQQEIQNQAQAASMLFQDDWNRMNMEQQKAMAELMYELQQQAMWGSDWDPNDFAGSASFQMVIDLMQSPELSDFAKNFLEDAMRKMYGDEAVDDWLGKRGGGGVGGGVGEAAGVVTDTLNIPGG